MTASNLKVAAIAIACAEGMRIKFIGMLFAEVAMAVTIMLPNPVAKAEVM